MAIAAAAVLAAAAVSNPDQPALLLALASATVGVVGGVIAGTSSGVDGLVRSRAAWFPWFWRLAGGVLMLVSGMVRLVQHSVDWPFISPFQMCMGAVLVWLLPARPHPAMNQPTASTSAGLGVPLRARSWPGLVGPPAGRRGDLRPPVDHGP